MSETAEITSQDVAAWKAHVGRRETRRQRLDVEMLRRYAAAVGASLDIEADPPPLAHWAFFLETVSGRDIGLDGHPLRGGGIMPPVTLPARMFAGAAVTFVEPLALGLEAELALTVADVRHRSGRSGDLVFVEVERKLTQEGRERLSERQTIVYRNAGAGAPEVLDAALPAAPGEEVWMPTAVDLFRFSAVTFNAHRIHYDLPYARDEEGYPGLVVHGPFTAVKLFAFAAASHPGRAITRFEFQARAPLFLGQAVRLRPAGSEGRVEAVRGDGVVAMTAAAEV